MCGIVAFFSPSTPVDPEALRRATATLHHRGPDGQRHWLDAKGSVGLGHARLSIATLPPGPAPSATALTPGSAPTWGEGRRSAVLPHAPGGRGAGGEGRVRELIQSTDACSS